MLIIGSTIYSANLGDSRAGIIAQEIKKGVNTNKLKFLQITKDHKPNLK